MAAAITCAWSAVRFTGTPGGPLVHCRAASMPSGSSGVRVWPTLVITTTPMPAPGCAQHAPPRDSGGRQVGQRTGIAVRGCVLVPGDLGEHVGLMDLGL